MCVGTRGCWCFLGCWGCWGYVGWLRVAAGTWGSEGGRWMMGSELGGGGYGYVGYVGGETSSFYMCGCIPSTSFSSLELF